MSAGKKQGVYLLGSHEFIKVQVERDGEPWVDDVQFSVVDRNNPPDTHTWTDAQVLDGAVGFYADTFAKGTWDVVVKVSDTPEIPIFYAGYFVIV